MAVLVVVAALAVGAAVIHQGSKKLKRVRAQVASETAALATLRSEAEAVRAQLEAAAWQETPDGLELAPVSRGVTKQDLAFLRSFRRPLLDRARVPARDVWSGAIAKSLRDDFAREGHLVDLPGLEGRERLIAYVLLRVNGSMPTYEIRDTVPWAFRELVLGTSGNCSDFAIRLMIALEALGMRTAWISSNTPAYPGHVFVDAYDPVDRRSYLLDANFNVMLSSPRARGEGFLSAWLGAGDAKSFADAVAVRAFPLYFRFVDPGAKGFEPDAVTADAINEQRADREQRWRRWLLGDAEALRAWWTKIPWHRPQTLQELAGRGAIELPPGFTVSGDYAQRLRVKAGLPPAPAAGPHRSPRPFLTGPA